MLGQVQLVLTSQISHKPCFNGWTHAEQHFCVGKSQRPAALITTSGLLCRNLDVLGYW